MKAINVLMATGEITKNGTLTTTLHKHSGEANIYFRFGNIPLTIFNHTLGHVSGSMDADTINMMQTSQNQQKKSWTKKLKDILDQSH